MRAAVGDGWRINPGGLAGGCVARMDGGYGRRPNSRLLIWQDGFWLGRCGWVLPGGCGPGRGFRRRLGCRGTRVGRGRGLGRGLGLGRGCGPGAMPRGVGATEPGGQPALQEGFRARHGRTAGANGGSACGGGGLGGEGGEAGGDAAQAVAGEHQQGGGETAVLDVLGQDQAKLLDDLGETFDDAGDRLRGQCGGRLGMRGTPGGSGGFRGSSGRRGEDRVGHEKI